MTVSFVAYIDESGDEGFKFRTRVGEQISSDWFVLSAFVTRKKTDIETVKVIDKVRDEFKLHPRKHIHWKDLKHPQKVRYAQIVANLRARLIAVCVHKPSLLEPEKFQQRYRLYFYAVRYLIERISWLVRDRHNPKKWGGDGTAELLLSNRQGMSYDEMRDYLRLLKKQQESGQDIRIEFDKVLIDKIKTYTPGKSMGLQLADATAGAFFNALERDKFGNTEPRYLQTLAPVLYCHELSIKGYGLKVVPREAIPGLIKNESLRWLSELK
ncbi:MAG: DUF3800 domain-containing protein [Planctomycetes bacterium]|nr:DUF3800 domain-containing protein [Planctomycetota bacterium]MBL7147085.1 DUF3800 domain-containing protein [Phycisphaerae bacterium]